MRKTIVIAVREYQAAVKTKTFIISVVVMPVFMGGAIVAQRFMEGKVDTADKRVAVLDQTGSLYDAIAEAARERDQRDVYEGEGPDRKKIRPQFLIERVEASSEDPNQTAFELSERVRNKELFAFVIIGPDVVEPRDEPTRARVAYHSNSPTYDTVENWLREVLNHRVQELRFAAVHLEPEVVKKATQQVPVANLGLLSLDEQGRIQEAEKTDKVVTFLVPIGMMMLMWMVVLVSASPLMQSVLEEKMQRIAEVLLGSVTPFELMMGKLIGIVGVSLTMATIYLAGGYYAIYLAGYAEFFPTHLIWWFVVFQAMAVLLYGSVFCAIGAAVSDMKEAQNLMTPVMLVVMAPMFVWMNVLKEPMATSSILMSLFPPATPMLMILRQAVPPGIPVWQPLLGVALVILTTVVCIFIAGRIFRVGILMQGKGAKVSEMVRWAIRG
ncbi:MAG: ABC transporter permease [Planctomycetes bacterium]|nr:ABC transporter permease [Planctomycetota bacterium]